MHPLCILYESSRILHTIFEHPSRTSMHPHAPALLWCIACGFVYHCIALYPIVSHCGASFIAVFLHTSACTSIHLYMHLYTSLYTSTRLHTPIHITKLHKVSYTFQPLSIFLQLFSFFLLATHLTYRYLSIIETRKELHSALHNHVHPRRSLEFGPCFCFRHHRRTWAWFRSLWPCVRIDCGNVLHNVRLRLKKDLQAKLIAPILKLKG